MSRLWTSSGQYVHVADDHLAIAQVKGGFSPQVVKKVCLPVEVDDPLSVQAALQEWLGAQASPQKVFLTLGHAHVRYFMLPWDRQLCDSHFREVMARALFERQFQLSAADYHVMCTAPQYGRVLLAAAAPVALLTAVSTAVQQCKGRVSRVEPLLSAVWRRFESRLAGTSGTLLIVESHRLLRVTHEQCHPLRIALRPFQPDEARALLMEAEPDASRQVFAPHFMAGMVGRPAHLLGLQEVSGFSPSRDTPHAFALCGVA